MKVRAANRNFEWVYGACCANAEFGRTSKLANSLQRGVVFTLVNGHRSATCGDASHGGARAMWGIIPQEAPRFGKKRVCRRTTSRTPTSKLRGMYPASLS